MFKPMRFANLHISEDETILQRLQYPLWVSPKIDAMRALCSGEAVHTKSLKLVRNNHAQDLFGKLPFGVDGELAAGDITAKNLLRATTSALNSFGGTPDLTFNVFDMYGPEPYKDRYQRLIETVESKYQFVNVVPQHECHSAEEVLFWEKHYLELGYEGLMPRSPFAPYKQGTATMLEGYGYKMKRFGESEAVVVGFEQELHNANAISINELGNTTRSSHKENMEVKDSIGAFICDHSVWGKIRVRALEGGGSWANRESYLGRKLTFTYQLHGIKDKPRHAQFKCFPIDR